MAGAFQSNAFQNDAFQVDASVVTQTDTSDGRSARGGGKKRRWLRAEDEFTAEELRSQLALLEKKIANDRQRKAKEAAEQIEELAQEPVLATVIAETVVAERPKLELAAFNTAALRKDVDLQEAILFSLEKYLRQMEEEEEEEDEFLLLMS